MKGVSDDHPLTRENERLRNENARLQKVLAELQGRLSEPEEIIRAIREGEIEALVVSDGSTDEIYAVQRYESVYQQLVEEALPYGVWLAEADGRLIYVSNQFLEWVQTDLQELQEKGQFHFLPEDVRREFEARWAECLISGEPCTVEYSVRSPDGSERAILTHGILTQQTGKPCWAGVNLDVTEQRQARKELQLKAEALEQADRRKDEFLALLGHELRNPMAVIQNGLHLVREGNGDAAQQARILQSVTDQVAHLTTMVDDLLDISRISRGAITLRKQPVNLTRAIDKALESVRAFAEKQGHALAVSSTPEPVELNADPTRLEQIFTNLLNNATKYTPPGGDIELSVTASGDEVTVRVRDTGIGIAPSALESIFELFVQSERGLDRSQGGLGVGLTVVRRLVELHGGRIEAYSEGRGKGSEFVVRLPIITRTTAGPYVEPAMRETAPVAPAEGLRVLVAEDSADLAHFLELALRSWGHEVMVAHDGPSALAACLEKLPEAVLLDIGLPGMDGHAVARRIREAPLAAQPILIAMSGYSQDHDRRRAKEGGFDHYLVKPAEPARLRELLSELARNRNAKPGGT